MTRVDFKGHICDCVYSGFVLVIYYVGVILKLRVHVVHMCVLSIVWLTIVHPDVHKMYCSSFMTLKLSDSLVLLLLLFVVFSTV